MAIQQVGKTSGSRNAEAEWFSSDLVPHVQPGEMIRWHIHFSIDTNSKVEYTLNSGSSWTAFDRKATQDSDSGFEYVIHVDGKDRVNFRAEQAVIIKFMRVFI